MIDDSDPPIKEQEFLAGVKIVDIGDYRVARGLTRRERGSCPHKSLIYDNHERRIWCKDCEKNVEAFDAFEKIVSQLDFANREIRIRREDVAEAERHSVISLAAKAIDKAWRKKKMLPCCPYCNHAMIPDDFKNIRTSIGKDFAMRQRATENKS